MTKISLFATSLVSALPAAYLCYLMVQAFLQRAEAMTSMYLVLAGSTLGICGLLLLMPFGILIFSKGVGGTATGKKPKKDKKGKESAAAANADDVLEADEDFEADVDDDFGQAAAFEQAEAEFEADELAVETEFDGMEAFGEVDGEDEFEEADVDLDNFDDFEFEDDEDDDK